MKDITDQQFGRLLTVMNPAQLYGYVSVSAVKRQGTL